MLENGSIKLTIKNNIGTIEFYHPKGNSLPGKLLRQLAKKITRAGKEQEIHVIVLKSKGEGAFCAGASFDELIAINNFKEGKRFFMGFSLVINAMRSSPKLIIARVQGKTVGGGVGLAAAADYTVAHKSASVKLSELSMGIGPFVIEPAVKRKISASAFSTLSLDARNWRDSAWAHQKGLFADVSESYQQLDKITSELASSLAASSPEAMKELKKTLWQGTDHWDRLLEKRAAISGKLVLSDYTKKFIADFKNK